MKEAIRGRQRPSEAFRGPQRSSEAIRGIQRPSDEHPGSETEWSGGEEGTMLSRE